jgi:hypothetical protein
MSEEEDTSQRTKEETKHFVNTFCDFHRAFPDENQHIFDQIYEEIKKADISGKDYIPGDKGQEEIWTFERHGARVYKRVFHPGSGERATGADFALYKLLPANKVGVTVVQVKRNRCKPYFELEQRDLTQRNRLARLWGSAYYLMVDETCTPPLYCFISTVELFYLIEQAGKIAPIKIPNTEIRRLCRGSDPFYNLFYSCARGSYYAPKEYLARIVIFTRRSKRVLVEISTRPRPSEAGTISQK